VITRALLLAALALLVAVPAALADDFDKVFADYSKDGKIDPCKHTAAQLQSARRHVPPDIEQYAPDFPDALDTAIEARAKGKCDKKKPAAAASPSTSGPVGATAPPPSTTTGTNGATTTGAAGTAASPPPSPTPDDAPAGAPTDNAIARAADANGGGSGSSDVPAPLIGLAIVAGLLALAGLAFGLARWRGWEPPWALRTRHALGEAGWRAGNTWSEFADWVRLGR
jgi:cobalamin biosynthesis Mg chelatase CobN